MAYTLLTSQIINKDGLVPSYSAATLVDGEMFRNTGKEFVHIINAGGSPVIVTFPTPAQVVGLDIEDKTVTVAAGTDQMIGTFEPGIYNQPTGDADAGKLRVEYDQITSVTVAILRT